MRMLRTLPALAPVFLFFHVACVSPPVVAAGDFSAPGGVFPGAPRLDHQRVRYGIFSTQTERAPVVREKARPVLPGDGEGEVMEEVPTFAEVEAAKARAAAETAMEISRRAEEAARDAVQEAAQARETSEKAIEAANRAIAEANESIAKVNEAIDRVNLINKEIRVEIARIEFEREQEIEKLTAALEEQQKGFDEEIARLKQEIEDMRVVLPDTYTVQRCDYLIKIAAREEIYGDSSHWRRIFEANRDKIRNPDLIYPGQELVIPR